MPEWKYEKTFEKLFCRNKVLSSSEITVGIRSEHPKCNETNARNIIRTARRKNVIDRIPDIVIGHNEYLYYVRTTGEKYTKKDVRACLCRDIRLATLIGSFEKNQGILSYLDICKISACSTQKKTGHVMGIERIKQIISYIYPCRVVSLENTFFFVSEQEYPIGNSRWFPLASDQIKQAKLECLMIRNVIYHMQKMNLINDTVPLYRNSKTPLKGIEYKYLMFDAMAYSSVPALNIQAASLEENDKGKDAIILFDVHIWNAYESGHLKGFYDRVQIIRNAAKGEKKNVIPIVAAMEIQENVRRSCRNMGILTYQFSDIYGSKINEILKLYDRIQETDSREPAEGNTNSIGQLLEMLENTGQGENLENLRGTLFEFLMHSVLYKWLRGQLTGNLITNYKINYDDNKKLVYEYDIIAPLYDEYLVIELKGYANSHFFRWGNKEESGKYEKETLGWFFRNTFPVAQKYYAHNPDNKKVKACFITTAHFDKEAKEQLGQIGKGKLKSAYMEVAYDGKELYHKLKTLKMSYEAEILKRYYLNR